MGHLTRAELEAGLDAIRQAPKDEGLLDLIVRRPRTNQREVLEQGELDVDRGLVGDRWGASRSRHRDTQLTLMNSRVIALVAGDKSRWPLAGDQLYVDFDLSEESVPPGTRLAIGGAIVEVSAEPHTGCGKFVERFGVDAMRFVNSTVGRQLHLRGINVSVVQAGTIRTGDRVTRLAG